MKRLSAIIGAVAFAATLTAPAFAGKGQPLDFSILSGVQRDNPVEQQSDWPWLPGPIDCSANERCVTNPTSCSWDVDDHWQRLSQDAVLAAGATGSTTACLFSDANPIYRSVNGNLTWWSTQHGKVGLEVRAPSSSLVVSIEYVAMGRIFTAVPHQIDTNTWLYQVCVNAVYDPGDSSLVLVSNSGTGGLAVRSDIIWRVTNPTSKAVRGITAGATVVGVGTTGLGCPIAADYQMPNREYPFRWLVE